MIRQGDVLLIPTNHKISKDAKPVPRNLERVVLTYGEATGHAHALAGPMTELFEEKDGQLYLRLGAADELRHVTDLVTWERTPDHDSHQLAPGTYRVVPQREYSPQEIRRVSD